MQVKHLLFSLKPKINKKKKPGFLFISSNRTFYITFVLSIIVHAGLIYSIPAVNLFSEGLESPPSDELAFIELDFLEESGEALSEDTNPLEENQFQADMPIAPPEQPDETELEEDLEFEEDLELEEDLKL